MVSVIISAYNSEMYIKSAIESVLNQTYRDIEIIAIDDGSSDRTAEIIKQYNKIKYIYQENRGPGAAKNLGINLSKGKYISFLDADDLYTEDKIEKQVNMLDRNANIHIVYNDLRVVDENIRNLSILKSEGIYDKREDFLTMMLVRQIIPGPASIMLRRECLESGTLFNEAYKFAEDYDFTLELAKKFTYGYIPESLYIYRRHNNNLTNNHKMQLQSEIEIVNKLGYEFLESTILKSSFSEEDKKLILAKVLIKINEWEKAKDVLLEILKTKESGLSYFYLGNCYYNILDYKDAKKSYINSLLLDDSLAESHNNLGCANIKLNNINEAKGEFIKALEIRKEYMDAYINLDNINQGNYNCKITEKELRKILTLYK